MRKNERGFNLVELLIVISILGIVASVAIPDLSTANVEKLKLATEEFSQAIRFARNEAIRTGEPHGFNPQSGAKRIRVFRADTSTSPWSSVYDVYHPISKKLYDIELDSHPFARADAVTLTTNFRGSCNINSIYFDNRGIARCSDPETILLKQLDLTFTLANHTRVVTLHGITGRVTTQ